MAKVFDETSKRAVAAAVQYYRDLGIYDLYRREVPAGMSFGHALTREALTNTSEVSSMNPSSKQNDVNATSLFATQETHPSESTTAPADTAEFPQLLATLKQEAYAALPKPEALVQIREELGDCHRCRLHAGRTNLVFGVGNPDTRIMFVGEGPGADEDAQGEPFVGRAGQLLNNMIAAMGIRREDIYIANVVKCRPPKNRAPENDESAICGPFLMRQIATIRPEMIVAMGATAAHFLLQTGDAMGRLRGRIYDFRPTLPELGPLPDFSTKLVVTYHPAYLLRDPRQKKETWADLQIVMKHLGMPLPKRETHHPSEG